MIGVLGCARAAVAPASSPRVWRRVSGTPLCYSLLSRGIYSLAMDTRLVGELIRLRYKLMWAKTSSRNGRVAMFLTGYLLLIVVVSLLARSEERRVGKGWR